MSKRQFSNKTQSCHYPCPYLGQYVKKELELQPPYDKNKLPAPPDMGEPLLDKFKPLDPKSYSKPEKRQYVPICKETSTCVCCAKREPGMPQPRSSYQHVHEHSQEQKAGNRSNKQTKSCIDDKNVSKSNGNDLEDTVGPYVPGQLADLPTDYGSVTVPYGDPKYCPCPSDKKYPQQNVANYKPEVCVSKEKPPAKAVPQKKSPISAKKADDMAGNVDDEFRPPGAIQQPEHEIQPGATGPTPCYMPQIADSITYKSKPMGPIGPWASGDINWGPLAGLTGTRPVVDKYTVTRFSEAEWRERNGKLVTLAADAIHQSSISGFEIQQSLLTVRDEADKLQQDSTKRLEDRAHDILRWKCELERAIAAAADELNDLELDRTRLKQAGAVLTLPEMIVGEALDLRTGRIETELVRDEVEEELMKEYSLIHEIRDVFYRTLESVEQQMIENKTAKTQLEFDWSDKTHACEIEMLNVALNNRSNVILFKPGSLRFQMDQSTPEHWEHFTRESIAQGERTRQKSFALRSSLDSILVNAARDLRSQADRVETALLKKTNCVAELIDVLEDQLKKVLKTIAEMEVKSNETNELIRRLDMAMKVAQTRLDNRMLRMRVENCRDPAQFGLIDENKQIAQQVTSLRANFDASDGTLGALIKQRSELERNIMILRKTLSIDRERIGKLRSFYPSATQLMGKG